MTKERQDEIIRATIEVIDVGYDEFFSRKKSRRFVYARHFASYLMFSEMFMSGHVINAEDKIGKLLGRDRTTIMHSIQLIKGLIDVKSDDVRQLNVIKAKLSGTPIIKNQTEYGRKLESIIVTNKGGKINHSKTVQKLIDEINRQKHEAEKQSSGEISIPKYNVLP